MTVRRSLTATIDHTGVPLLLARLGVGGWFAYLAILKLLDPITFLKEVREYGILSVDPPLLNLTAIVLPSLELVCAAALVLGVARRGAALLVGGMLILFTPMLVLRAQGLVAAGIAPSFCQACFDCGCGTGVVCICAKLIENGALMIGTLVALLSQSRRFCLDAEAIRWLDATGIPLLVARIGLGGMLAFAAIAKLVNPAAFVTGLHAHALVPVNAPFCVNAAGIILPFVELLVAAAVLLGVWRRGAALLASGVTLFLITATITRAAGVVAEPGSPFRSIGAVVVDNGWGLGEQTVVTFVITYLALLAGALIVLLSRSSRLCLIERDASPPRLATPQ